MGPFFFLYLPVCRHAESRTADGTIQPLNNDITGPPRECAFSIIAPVDQFLRISCSFANFTSPRNFVRVSQKKTHYVVCKTLIEIITHLYKFLSSVKSLMWVDLSSPDNVVLNRNLARLIRHTAIELIFFCPNRRWKLVQMQLDNNDDWSNSDDYTKRHLPTW